MIILFQIIVLVFSVVIHEVAHGAMARFLGDKTAEYQGRLTLNPLKHIDPMGSVILPLILVLSSSPILFGWAKPVPYNPYNLRRGGKYAEGFVALAGPLANILIALAIAIILRAGIITGTGAQLAQYIVFLNIFLAVFNLIPIPPLDGSKVLDAVLPTGLQHKYNHFKSLLEQNPFLGMGLVILLVTLFGSLLHTFVTAIVRVLLG